MRAAVIVFAVLALLACASVSASSADWSAPEALWSSDLSSSELEARHSEFLMATDASSTGPADSSTGTVAAIIAPATVVLTTVPSVATVTNSLQNDFGFPKLAGESFSMNVTAVAGSSSSSSTGAADNGASSSSSAAAGTAGRRLLQAGGSQASFNFVGSPLDGGVHAQQIYAAFTESLQCTTPSCQSAISKKYSLPVDLAQSALVTSLAAAVVPGTLQTDQAAVAAGNTAALDQASGERFVSTQGGPRKTNIGYYVLGAVVLAFAVAALIYFLVHKKPTTTIVKEEPLRRDEVAMAPVVAAPVANSGVVVAEEQPLAGNQQQMDYRSVFALKHNVLDKSAEQKAAEEDEHNHNDVHFILHQ